MVEDGAVGPEGGRAADRSGDTGAPVGGSSPWRGIWALAFVGVSLVALVAVPAFYGRRVTQIQTRISDVLEPAARNASSLPLLLGRQMARMDGFILTGDRATFREPYTATIALKDQNLRELRELSRRMDPDAGEEVFFQIAGLVSVWARWDFANQQFFEPDQEAVSPVEVRVGYLEEIRLGYQEVEQAIRELDGTIESVLEAGRRDLRSAAAIQSRLTAALAVLALFGTVIVGRIGWRYRELVLERETRRREAVRARREIDSLLEATGDGVLGIDLDGRCTSLNRAGSALLGYTEGEMTGRDVHDTLFHSRPDGTPNPRGSSEVLAAVAAGEPLDSEPDAILWRRRRVPFPARWSLRPLLDGIELRGAVLTFTDMTEIREKEEALRRAVRVREDVVSIVSHDLRNPLGVVLAAADLLLELPLEPDRRRRQAQIIQRSGRRMQSLIEDLLDVARIEAGALVVRPSLEDLVPILEEAAQLFQDQAERKGIALVVSHGEGDLSARVDRDRVMQALANLLDNAIRLTETGGSVTLRADGHPDDVRVRVLDTGPGIEPELLEHIFDRFHQSAKAGRGGAGLGLAIVQGVAEAHDGGVAVESRLGVGTTFELVFPRSGPPLGEDRPADPDQPDGEL